MASVRYSTARGSQQNSKNARLFLWAALLLTLATYVLPFGRMIGLPLVLLSTLAHEMGHGLFALVMGGRFEAFYIWSDASGLARTASLGGAFSQAMVAAGGLLGPAIAASCCFLAAKNAAVARLFLSCLGVALLAAEFLLVRNVFGFVFVGAIAALCLWLAQQSKAQLAQIALVFFGIQLALSVFSRSDYLFTPSAVTAQGVGPSDVALIANALILPYWFWGAVCGAFSLFILFLGMWQYLKK